MTKILSHKEWMKLTYGGATSRRSSLLKTLDAAILQHEKVSSSVHLEAVTSALMAWMTSKGNAWKTSVRNKKNAVDTLYKQVSGVGTGKEHNPLELSRIRDESRAIITDLFRHRQLEFRPGLLTKLASNEKWTKAGAISTVSSVGYYGKAVAGTSTTTSSSGAKLLSSKLVRESMPPEIAVEVMAALVQIMPDFLTRLAASCTPFVGVAFSGGTAVVGAYNAAMAKYTISNSAMHAERMLSEDEPEEAFKAVIRMLQRELNNTLAELTRAMATFGSKLGAMLADAGTATNAAIGLASSLVSLLMLLRLLVRDILERNAANKLLKQPIITIELFQACPVMGAYLVCCAPTSVLVNTMLSSDRFYEPGMMDTVERVVARHIEPLKIQARRLVNEHRMYIPALQAFPGVLEKNEKELKRMLKSKGKTGMVGFGSDDLA